MHQARAARVCLTGITTTERQTLAEAHLGEVGPLYPLLNPDAVSSTVFIAEGASAAINVDLTYALDGSMLDLATVFLNLDIASLQTGAYLAY